LGSRAAPRGALPAGAPTSSGPATLHVGVEISTTSGWTTIKPEFSAIHEGLDQYAGEHLMSKLPSFFRVVVILALPAIACSSLSGLAASSPSPESPTSWMQAVSPLAPIATSASSATTIAPDVPTSPAGGQQEVSILKCQNDPAQGIVSARVPVVLVWGWKTDDETKRSELISISSFVLDVDGQARDLSSADQVLEAANTVYWKLSIGQLPQGTHQIQLTATLAREFVDSGGTTPAGSQSVETCQLVVQ
jgi:hypothetical protein